MNWLKRGSKTSHRRGIETVYCKSILVIKTVLEYCLNILHTKAETGKNSEGTQLSKGEGPTLHEKKVYARLSSTKNNQVHYGRPNGYI
jgi:hypothetical protein